MRMTGRWAGGRAPSSTWTASQAATLVTKTLTMVTMHHSLWPLSFSGQALAPLIASSPVQPDALLGGTLPFQDLPDSFAIAARQDLAREVDL